MTPGSTTKRKEIPACSYCGGEQIMWFRPRCFRCNPPGPEMIEVFDFGLVGEYLEWSEQATDDETRELWLWMVDHHQEVQNGALFDLPREVWIPGDPQIEAALQTTMDKYFAAVGQPEAESLLWWIRW